MAGPGREGSGPAVDADLGAKVLPVHDAVRRVQRPRLRLRLRQRQVLPRPRAHRQPPPPTHPPLRGAVAAQGWRGDGAAPRPHGMNPSITLNF